MTAPPVPSIDAEGADRYDGWRRQWCAGSQNQAIALLRHHGMARALALTAPPPPAPAGSSPDPSAVPECTAVTREAVQMIHALLVQEAGEPPHA